MNKIKSFRIHSNNNSMYMWGGGGGGGGSYNLPTFSQTYESGNRKLSRKFGGQEDD